MRVLVTGGTGQLGQDVCNELIARKINCQGINSKDCDLIDMEGVLHLVKIQHPDAIIHCAAYTNVDQAEREPERCMMVNATGTRNLAEVCKSFKIKLLYVSTDYVFSGNKTDAYQVWDDTEPLNVYGRSKLAGEEIIRELLTDFFIVRTSWVFGEGGNNFVKSMLRLSKTTSEVRVVCDQIGSPTYTVDLAQLLCDMIVTDKFGTYHATNEGECSWATFAEEIFGQINKPIVVKHITSNEYPTTARRPNNSVLSKVCLDERNFGRLPSWQDALVRYIKTTALE